MAQSTQQPGSTDIKKVMISSTASIYLSIAMWFWMPVCVRECSQS